MPPAHMPPVRVTVTEYSDSAAYAVLSRLDPADLAECEAAQGRAVTPLGLFGDWRAMQAHWVASFVARAGEGVLAPPIALFGLANTGQGGVAAAVLLACNHRTYRRELGCLAVAIRAQLPLYARARGIRRIEARCWSRHPMAGRMLMSLGFGREAVLAGFGPEGTEVFHQYALLPFHPQKET